MILWILATLVIVYLFLLLLLYLLQTKMVYFPSHYIEDTPDKYGLKYEDVYLNIDSGPTIHGWYVPADSARATLIFCHGNAGNISHRLESIGQFNRQKLNVLIFDYPGYGNSNGKAAEENTYRAAEAAYNYLTDERHIESDKIIIFGRSLGGAIAVWLASTHPARALIVESSFTSIGDAAAFHYPFVPAKLIIRYKYNSIDAIGKVKIPLLVIHSPNDEIIPYKHGRALFEAANEPKQFLEITGSHNDGYLTTGDKYDNGIKSFLDSYLTQ